MEAGFVTKCNISNLAHRNAQNEIGVQLVGLCLRVETTIVLVGIEYLHHRGDNQGYRQYDQLKKKG